MGGIRVGVAGVGSLGFHHARLLKNLPGATLIGIHDASVERLNHVSAELDIPAFADLSALLDRVDALVIAVTTRAHETVARPALERGIHVLIEKPIAATVAEADRILEAARGTGALVQIGHVERFNAAIQACEPYLDEPMFVESHRLAPFGVRGTDVAVVLDLMIHDLDLVLSLMRRPVQTIAAVGVAVLTTSPDIANARLEFDGGGVANLTASRISLERMRKIRFFQRSGYISLDLAAGRGEFLRLRPGVSLEALQAAASVAATDANGGVVAASSVPSAGLIELVERISLQGVEGEPLQRELTSFIAAASGEAPVPVTGDDGRRALAVALEIIDRISRHGV
ncbi:MAG: Gfo/Idh/MocA family oxidoreductase [Longimicrobiales bacterium]